MDQQNTYNNSTCRACLENTKDNNNMKSIYKVEKLQNANIKFCTMLNYCTNLDVYEGDGLPGKICKRCADDVVIAFTFKQQFIRANAILREKLPFIDKNSGGVQKSYYEFEYAFVQLKDPNGNDADDTQADLERLNFENTFDKPLDCNENQNIIDIGNIKVEEELLIQDQPLDSKDIVKLKDSNSFIASEIGCDDGNDAVDTPAELEGLNFETTFDESLDCNENQNIIDIGSIKVEEELLIQDRPLDSKDNQNIIDKDKIKIEEELLEKKNKISEKLKITIKDNEKAGMMGRAKSSYIRKMKRKPKTQQTFSCEICAESLSSAGAFKTHMLIHSGSSLFLCSICGAGFKTKTGYEDHLVSHDPNTTFKCEECNKCYTNGRTLKDHKARSHNLVKPFVCGVCGKGLTQKVALQRHMMIHTGEKPFECDVCGKRFRYQHVLVSHNRYHTGERPYSCTECGQTFVGQSHYRTHLLIHSGVKPYECDICGKCFNRRTNLRSHRKIHTGEREHICSICGKGFIQNNCLRAHMVTHEQQKRK